MWNDGERNGFPSGGGGGISVVFSQPPYQTTTCPMVGTLPGTGEEDASTPPEPPTASKMREVPDIALTADAARYGSSSSGCGCVTAGRNSSPVGGYGASVLGLGLMARRRRVRRLFWSFHAPSSGSAPRCATSPRAVMRGRATDAARRVGVGARRSRRRGRSLRSKSEHLTFFPCSR